MTSPSSAVPPASILMNASVMVFLFQALAKAKEPVHREQVERQLLRLLSGFLGFESGTVLLEDTNRRLESRFLEIAPPGLWQKLVKDGCSREGGITATPLYAGGMLGGVLILRGAGGDAELVLSAIASLAAAALESAREVEKLTDYCTSLEQQLFATGGIVGGSGAVRKMLDRIGKLASRDTTVLIQGESGTGKELAARLLHRASPRAEGPFAAINCAAIAESLIESELFGYEKGAFTGAFATKKGKLEAASGGTLFLDEIGELAPPMQAKLLRVLQERVLERVGGNTPVRVDLRVVAATNRDLSQAVRDGSFRADLYHRLNVVSLRTPPLRERKEDIPALASHFLQRFAGKCNLPTPRLAPETLRCLESYDWPGNIRELENAIEHAVVLGNGVTIEPSDLPENILESPPDKAGEGAFQTTVLDAKRASIVRAYQQSGGDYKGAARLLGLHPNYLLRLVRTLDLREAVRRSS